MSDIIFIPFLSRYRRYCKMCDEKVVTLAGCIGASMSFDFRGESYSELSRVCCFDGSMLQWASEVGLERKEEKMHKKKERRN